MPHLLRLAGQRPFRKATAKVEQYRHKSQRLENRIRDYQQGKRKKRTHRLITRGVAVENVAPEIREMSERNFYILIGQIFALPEVDALVSRISNQQEGG